MIKICDSDSRHRLTQMSTDYKHRDKKKDICSVNICPSHTVADPYGMLRNGS